MARQFNWEFSKTKMPSVGEMNGLVRFYMWKCPVPGVSVRGKTLAEYGWKAANINTLRAEIRHQSTLTRGTFKTVGSTDELILVFEELGVLQTCDLSKEFAICYSGGKTSTDAFFYMIRNAIAHGSFCLRSRNHIQIIVLETRNKGSLRGRAVLRVETLQKIKSIVEHSGRYLKS